MKKYYTHDGNVQKGPYDIEGLKEQGINKETMIWFDGISNWTKAGEINELQEIFKIIPPPFKIQDEKLYEKEKIKVVEKYTEVKKKKSFGKIFLSIILIILVLIGAIVVINVINNPSNNSLIKVTVNPPKPRVVFDKGGEDPSSTLFNYKAGIDASVLNQGGSGHILVTCILHQGENDFEQSQDIYMTENETKEIHFTFEEAKLLGSEIKYSIKTKAIE